MNDASLVAHQLRYDLLVNWRNPQSRFFTIVLPVIFLVLLTSLFGNHTTYVNGSPIKNSTFYVPGISTLGVVAVSFVNLVITIVALRESGVLKRRRSTPVPAWVLIASRALTAVILSIVVVVVLVAIGRILYGVHIPSGTLPAFLLGVFVGAACFCCLSFAVGELYSQRGLSSADHPGDRAAAVLHLRRLRPEGPTLKHASRHRQHLSDQSFEQHLLQGVQPRDPGVGIAGHDLLILALWGVGGLVVALWRFSWSPLAAD